MSKYNSIENTDLIYYEKNRDVILNKANICMKMIKGG